ncbi:MAG TPA: hypothetical protein PKD55_05585 [Bellilinea sp.]|nr:hypothetical protein [Bellilinea sp.]
MTKPTNKPSVTSKVITNTENADVIQQAEVAAPSPEEAPRIVVTDAAVPEPNTPPKEIPPRTLAEQEAGRRSLAAYK